MKIFITGATGFIGFAITAELIRAGHQVTGLARSDKSAQLLTTIGAESHPGALENLSGLIDGAKSADTVIHCAYDHSFSNLEETAKKETQAIEALGQGLHGSSRPLIVTSVVGMGCAVPGKRATEDFYDPRTHNPRRSTEIAAARVGDSGVNVSVVRLPQVHNEIKQGFITALIKLAADKGISAYVAEGTNQWAAAHLLDVARLYRLVVEKPRAGLRYHAVAEEGISLYSIAKAISVGLNIPLVSLSSEAAKAHFGWLAMFAEMDMRASSALTRQRIPWHPSHDGLLKDIEQSFLR
ncbi:SDR family oxidoreductase [Erwinia sp. 9145]|uniref:SDR family oxidoreductase n=1 Tax=Erwinia sp. 9145 TaxID=1500895 RepID=UPI000550A125|nr:SDR family oxidoreductase [Erwinia sp. 9145]